ncbi:acyl carrier protein [Nocardia sp. BMG51109]|uniref:acyl carrier protein n=1 Tax=Nocardia sp. BMG51109 TaxID=1056816 RepID=UPI000465EBD5|nr:acyl carrier protein [Nocardia sp. BMG51109]
MAIEDTIKKILVDQLFVAVPAAQIGLDDGLRDELGVDSLGFVELRAQCGDTFAVQITDDDFVPANFATVRKLAAFISDRRATAAPENRVES